MRFLILAALACFGCLGATQVVILGAGAPRPDPDRPGPAAVIHNGRAYLCDAGPGVVRPAAAAAKARNITALTAYRVNVHEIEPGFIYDQDQLKITAIAVHHGSWQPAFGHGFDTPDVSIVISGDCSPSPATGGCCKGLRSAFTRGLFSNRAGARPCQTSKVACVLERISPSTAQLRKSRTGRSRSSSFSTISYTGRPMTPRCCRMSGGTTMAARHPPGTWTFSR